MLESRITRVYDILNCGPRHRFVANGKIVSNCNWQNFRRGGEIRKSLLTHPEQEFVVGDLAQIEARVTAWLCGCNAMLEAFADPKRDLYCEFGTRAFNKLVTKAQEYERFSSKTVVLGSGFGAGGRTVHKQMQAEIRKRRLPFAVPDEVVCDGLVGFYRDEFREIPQGWKRLEEFVRHPGAEFGPCLSVPGGVKLPNGLMLHYPRLSWDEWTTKRGDFDRGLRFDGRKGRTPTWGGKLMENHASALTRCIVTWQLVRLDKDLRGLGGRVAGMSHDELICVTPVVEHDTAMGLVNRWLTLGPEWCAGLPLACEVKSGHTYGELREEKR
jgi:DNA polymerase